MAKKMDFLDFISDLPDEEGDELKADASCELQWSVSSGAYYRVEGSKIVLVKDKDCKKKR